MASNRVNELVDKLFSNMMHLDRQVKNEKWWVMRDCKMKHFGSKEMFEEYIRGLDTDCSEESLGKIASRLAERGVISDACWTGEAIYET